MSQELRRLPDGKHTTSVRRYLSEWRKITRAVEKRLDARVYAFDPDLGVCAKNGQGSFSLPLWAAKKLAGEAE